MAKIAFIFPGQGAQKAGMGQDIYDEFDIAKDIFDKANEVLGYDLKEICFTDENEVINQTLYSQPAIYTTSVAILEVLKSKGFTSDDVVGLSLGEYTALYEAGVFTFEEGLKIVSARAKFMQEECTNVSGTMAAVLGMNREELTKLCSDVTGKCEIANYNCPGQLVITGEVDAVGEAVDKAKEYGAKRAIPLNVSGPFHSSILEKAGANLNEFLKGYDLNEPSKNIYMNVTGKKYSGDLKELMYKQVTSSVMFEDSINEMMSSGVDTFIELGPGKVLSGFMKKIDKTKTILNVEDFKSLNKTIESLNGE